MSQTAAVVVFMIVFIGALGIKAMTMAATQKANQADGVIASYGDLRMTTTSLLEGFGPQAPSHVLAGLTARVEDSGTLNRRITATRLALLGPFALAAKKKQDDREIYLTIEGPNTAILRTIQLRKHPHAGTEARQFAAQVNLRSRQTSHLAARPDVAEGDIDSATSTAEPRPSVRLRGIRRPTPPAIADSAAPLKVDVVLFDVGRNKIQTIQVVRRLIPGLGLREAKELVEAAPTTILQRIECAQAENVKSELEQASATVVLH